MTYEYRYTGTNSNDQIDVPDGTVQVFALSGNDVINVTDSLFGDYFDGGEGYDSLQVSGNELTIDFSKVYLNSIDQINIYTTIWTSDTVQDIPRYVVVTDEIFNGLSWLPSVSLQGRTGAELDASALSVGQQWNLDATSGDDTITGGAADEIIRLWGGNDVIDTGSGQDQINFHLGQFTPASIAGQSVALVSDGPDTWHFVFAGARFITIEQVDPSKAQFKVLDARDPAAMPEGQQFFGTALISNAEKLKIDLSISDDGGDSSYGWQTLSEINVSFLNGQMSLALFEQPIFGSAGNDTLIGTSLGDRIFAFTGSDQIEAGAGNDTIEVSDNASTDTINGGAGQDVLRIKNAPAGPISFGSNIVGIEQVIVETFEGDPVRNITITNDVMSDVQLGAFLISVWGNGDANIDAQGVNQRISISAGGGNTAIFSGSGSDWISGWSGNETVSGGAGRDTFSIYLGRIENHELSGLALSRLDNGDWMLAKGETPWFLFQKVTDTQFRVTDQRDPDMLLPSGPFMGADLLTSIEQVSFQYSTINALGQETWSSWADIAVNIGSSGLVLNIVGSPISGTSGDDTLIGGIGNDYIIGSLGNDEIIGFYGFDTISYRELGAGNTPSLNAGLDVDFGVGKVVYVDANNISRNFTDTLISVETIRATDFADTIDASSYGLVVLGNVRSGFTLFNTIAAGRGNDTITGNGSTFLDFRDDNATEGITIDVKEGYAISNYFGNKTLLGGINSFQGTQHNDLIKGGDPKLDWFETYRATLGSDTIDGGSGYDRVEYDRTTLSTGGLTISLIDGNGTVSGKSNGGVDTLRNIEAVRGTQFADSITFTNSSGSITNHQAEGGGGNDTITGNGVTILRYSTARAGVHVNLATGLSKTLNAAEDAGIGLDTFSGVNGVLGGAHDDLLIGGNPFNEAETFRGEGGNDTIDGGEGWDIAAYNAGGNWIIVDGRVVRALDDEGTPTYTTGIHVQLAAGIVTGDPIAIGTDTLRSIEDVRGTVNNDVFDARGFSASSVNAGSLDTRNSFRGGAGDDIVYGNGNTRIDYRDARAGVFVDLESGVGRSLNVTANDQDAARVGVDRVYGVNIVLGSEFSDHLIGGKVGEFGAGLIGYGGDDTLIGGLGMTVFEGGAGNDHIVAGNRGSVARYKGNFADFDIKVSQGKLLVTDLRDGSPEGNDVLENIYVLRFEDRDHFVLGLANRSVLVGENKSYFVSNGDMVVGTSYAEQFEVPDNASPFIFTSAGDTVKLSMGIDEYVVRAFGNQLHMTEKNGNNTAFINVSGPITVVTSTGEAEVSFDFPSKIMRFGDSIVQNNGFDTLSALQRYTVDPQDSQWFSASGLVEIPGFAIGSNGDVIEYSDAGLTVGAGVSSASPEQALINQTTGKATFSEGSGADLDDALADIAAAMSAATDAPGEIALFKVGGTGNYHLFISDGYAGVTETDVVLELIGISNFTGIDLTDGHLVLT